MFRETQNIQFALDGRLNGFLGRALRVAAVGGMDMQVKSFQEASDGMEENTGKEYLIQYYSVSSWINNTGKKTV